MLPCPQFRDLVLFPFRFIFLKKKREREKRKLFFDSQLSVGKICSVVLGFVF